MWLAPNNPPVPNSPLKYWSNVGDILHSANFQPVPVGARAGVPVWQPPVSRQTGALLNRGGPVSGFPN